MKKESARNRTTMKWLGGVALGAAAMYLSDPDRGRRRRALARDKMQSLAVRAGDALDIASRDFVNRVQGLRARASQVIAGRRKRADDSVVAARVRAKIGRTTSHPHAIKVMVHDGCVTLNGPVLAEEKEQLLNTVRVVPGVTAVEDQLQVHAQPDNIAGLQGEGRLRQMHPPFMRENWPPALRAIAMVGGSTLSYYGLRRRTPAGALLTLIGFGLLTRSISNRPLMHMLDTAGRQAIDLQKTIHIAAPPETVFDLWSNYQNFPHFMSNVREVRDLGEGRSHWVVSGPVGIPIEWDAALTESTRPEKLAWRSAPDSPVQHTGEIHFEPENGGTRVSIHMSYSPPAGAIGHAVASLFGGNPKREMDEDLMRMKTFIERGIPPHDAAQPISQQDVTLH